MGGGAMLSHGNGGRGAYDGEGGGCDQRVAAAIGGGNDRWVADDGGGRSASTKEGGRWGSGWGGGDYGWAEGQLERTGQGTGWEKDFFFQ